MVFWEKDTFGTAMKFLPPTEILSQADWIPFLEAASNDTWPVKPEPVLSSTYPGVKELIADEPTLEEARVKAAAPFKVS